MKKLFALFLAMMMVFSLAACGGGDDEKTSSSDNPPANGQQQEQSTPDPVENEPDNTPAADEGFSIPTLNSYDTFPSADYWTALGLPADFTIEITEMEFSSKNSIYPLNAKDGNMFTCVVSDNVAAYTTLADSLWNAGIKGVSADGTNITEAADRGEVDDYDIDEHIYKAYWLNNGELMDIYIRTRDGSNKITITVRYAPED